MGGHICWLAKSSTVFEIGLTATHECAGNFLFQLQWRENFFESRLLVESKTINNRIYHLLVLIEATTKSGSVVDRMIPAKTY